MPPSTIIKELGVNQLKVMGFRNITDEDTKLYRKRYRLAREKVRKLDQNLIKSSYLYPDCRKNLNYVHHC